MDIKTKVYCILLKNKDVIYIQCEKNGIIMGFKTKQNAFDCWEIPYKQAFHRGLCGATGAMLAHIGCNPSVVSFESQENMIDVLFNKPPFQLNTFGMTCNGIKVQKDALGIWKKGEQPELVEIEGY